MNRSSEKLDELKGPDFAKLLLIRERNFRSPIGRLKDKPTDSERKKAGRLVHTEESEVVDTEET